MKNDEIWIKKKLEFKQLYEMPSIKPQSSIEKKGPFWTRLGENVSHSFGTFPGENITELFLRHDRGGTQVGDAARQGEGQRTSQQASDKAPLVQTTTHLQITKSNNHGHRVAAGTHTLGSFYGHALEASPVILNRVWNHDNSHCCRVVPLYLAVSEINCGFSPSLCLCVKMSAGVWDNESHNVGACFARNCLRL